jgi:hypothetical protein
LISGAGEKVVLSSVVGARFNVISVLVLVNTSESG